MNQHPDPQQPGQQHASQQQPGQQHPAPAGEPAAPQPVSADGDLLTLLAQQAEEVLRSTQHRMQVVEPQLRRFARAVIDLGLPVPADWATQGDDRTVTFSSLTPRQFDAMIRLFEDIAANRPIVITRGQSGPTLFDPGSAVGPAPAPVVSTVHMSVPR